MYIYKQNFYKYIYLNIFSSLICRAQKPLNISQKFFEDLYISAICYTYKDRYIDPLSDYL